jgi:hypothetical protein
VELYLQAPICLYDAYMDNCTFTLESHDCMRVRSYGDTMEQDLVKDYPNSCSASLRNSMFLWKQTFHLCTDVHNSLSSFTVS